jgi:hypothetical protein
MDRQAAEMNASQEYKKRIFATDEKADAHR